MWEDSNYCWVVLCKNHWFHFRRTLFNSHRIPLGETDAVMSPPVLRGRFPVRCDECGKEYLYKPSDVTRYEQDLPEGFTPHPLFQPGGDRRRSERAQRDVRLLVSGETLRSGAFEEKTYATCVSANGAMVVLSARVTLGQPIFLKDPRTKLRIEGRVVRFGPPYKGLNQVGVEFVQPVPEFAPAESRIA